MFSPYIICGVASLEIGSTLGKSLVRRIYHDRREMQFVVLNSIRMLVWECPSAFIPFLNIFFVKAIYTPYASFRLGTVTKLHQCFITRA